MGIDMFLYVSDTPEIPDNYATTIMEDYDGERIAKHFGITFEEEDEEE